jgi:hypothetical protein
VKRLIVAGSRGLRLRHVNNVRDAIRMFVDMYWRPTHIVCGGCHDENSGEDAIGADMLGAHLALKAGVKIDLVPADWSQGKSGGPRRNQAMVDVADGLVCVRYPHSRGSADVVRRAETKGIPVVEMLLEDERAAAKPMRAMGGRW